MIISNKNTSKIQELLNLYYWVIGDENFLTVLTKHSNGEGFGVENIWCVFAHDYEPWEEDYFGENGVAYYFDEPAVEYDQTIILNYDEFVRYLKIQSDKYLERNKDKRDEVEILLDKVEKKVIELSK